MRTRVIAAALAVVLAAVGTVVLLMYVRSASSQSAAPAAPPVATVDVLVASSAIAVGAPAAGLGKLVATKPLPTDAALPNRVTDLNQLTGKVALVAIEPGEQLLAGKFGTAPAVTTSSTSVKVPPNLQQLTILLRPDQALGGKLKPGDTVGVFISLKPEKGSGLTHLVVHKVLVTAVEESVAAPVTSASPTTVTSAQSSSAPATPSAAPTTTAAQAVPNDPTVSVLVTLATTAGSAEKIVWAAEYGSIWLSNEPLTADQNGTGTIDDTKVLK